MTGISAGQFEKLTRLGFEMDGKKVLVRAWSEISSDTRERRAYYVIELPDDVHDDLWLRPAAGAGSIAESSMDPDRYEYTHGGPMYRAAVDVARELASALGF